MDNLTLMKIEEPLFDMFAEVEQRMKEAEQQETEKKRDLNWIMNPPHFTYRFGALYEMRLATGENVGDFAIYARMHWQEIDRYERNGTFPTELSHAQRSALTALANALLARMMLHGDTRKATRLHEDWQRAGLELPPLNT